MPILARCAHPDLAGGRAGQPRFGRLPRHPIAPRVARWPPAHDRRRFALHPRRRHPVGRRLRAPCSAPAEATHPGAGRPWALCSAPIEATPRRPPPTGPLLCTHGGDTPGRPAPPAGRLALHPRRRRARAGAPGPCSAPAETTTAGRKRCRPAGCRANAVSKRATHGRPSPPWASEGRAHGEPLRRRRWDDSAARLARYACVGKLGLSGSVPAGAAASAYSLLGTMTFRRKTHTSVPSWL